MNINNKNLTKKEGLFDVRETCPFVLERIDTVVVHHVTVWVLSVSSQTSHLRFKIKHYPFIDNRIQLYKFTSKKIIGWNDPDDLTLLLFLFLKVEREVIWFYTIQMIPHYRFSLIIIKRKWHESTDTYSGINGSR